MTGQDTDTPVGLPSKKIALLDFGGRYSITTGRPADDINDWTIHRIPGPRIGLSNKEVPVLSWASVEKLVRQSSKNEPVLFDLVGTQQEMVAARGKTWNE